jgi:hypothetical protein
MIAVCLMTEQVTNGSASVKIGRVSHYHQFPIKPLSCQHGVYKLEVDVTQNRDLSGQVCLLFYFSVVVQPILKIMKGNTESPCILNNGTFVYTSAVRKAAVLGKLLLTVLN